MSDPLQTPTPAPSPAPEPVTVSATVDAATKGDFAAFQEAAVAARRGTPKAAVPVTAAESPAAPPAEPLAAPPPSPSAPPAEPPALSKRQQDANERTRRAVEQATEDLRREVADLRARVAGSPPAPPPVQEPAWKRYAAMPDAPKIDDFASVEEHTAAMSYFIATKLQQETADAARSRAHAEQRQRFLMDRGDQFETKLRAAAEADPDFLDKIPPALVTARPLSGLTTKERARATFANVAAEAAFRSEHPDTLLTYLHAHQDEVVAIASLPPFEWLPRLIHLDGRLSGPPAAPAAPAPAATVPPSPISAAPPPPPTIQRAGSAGDPKQAALAKGDFATFQQLERAERAAKRATA